MLRGLGFSLVIVVATNVPRAQAILATGILSVYFAFQVRCWHWKTRSINLAGLVLNGLLLLLLKQSSPGVMAQEEQFAMDATLVLLILVVLCISILLLVNAAAFMSKFTKTWTGSGTAKLSVAVKACAEKLAEIETHELHDQLKKLNIHDIKALEVAIALISTELQDGEFSFYKPRATLKSMSTRLSTARAPALIPDLTRILEQLHEQISAAQQRLQCSRSVWRRCVKGGGLAEAKEERLVKAAQAALEETGAEAQQMKKNYLKERDRLRQRLRCQRMQHRQAQQKAKEEAETKVKALELRDLRGPETAPRNCPAKAAPKASAASARSLSPRDGAQDLREKLKRYVEQEKELKSRRAELQSSAQLSERVTWSVSEWTEELNSLAQRRKTQRLQLRQVEVDLFSQQHRCGQLRGAVRQMNSELQHLELGEAEGQQDSQWAPYLEAEIRMRQVELVKKRLASMIHSQSSRAEVLDSAVAEIHQDLDRRAQDILHLAQRARFAKSPEASRAETGTVPASLAQRLEVDAVQAELQHQREVFELRRRQAQALESRFEDQAKPMALKAWIDWATRSSECFEAKAPERTRQAALDVQDRKQYLEDACVSTTRDADAAAKRVTNLARQRDALLRGVEEERRAAGRLEQAEEKLRLDRRRAVEMMRKTLMKRGEARSKEERDAVTLEAQEMVAMARERQIAELRALGEESQLVHVEMSSARAQLEAMEAAAEGTERTPWDEADAAPVGPDEGQQVPTRLRQGAPLRRNTAEVSWGTLTISFYLGKPGCISSYMWVMCGLHTPYTLNSLNSTMAPMAWFLALTLWQSVTTALPTLPRRVASGDWEEVMLALRKDGAVIVTGYVLENSTSSDFRAKAQQLPRDLFDGTAGRPSLFSNDAPVSAVHEELEEAKKRGTLCAKEVLAWKMLDEMFRSSPQSYWHPWSLVSLTCNKGGLLPHTDGYVYGDALPDFVALLCQEPSTEGGGNTLIDGRRFFDRLDPELVRWLEQTPVDLSEGDQGITVGRAAQGPVIQYHGERLKWRRQINVEKAQRTDSWKPLDHDQRGDQHETSAYLSLWKPLPNASEQEAKEIQEKLELVDLQLQEATGLAEREGLFYLRSGEALVLDNWRLLHSRQPYQGQSARKMWRIWSWTSEGSGLPSDGAQTSQPLNDAVFGTRQRLEL
eukprot:s282_g42.t1